MASKYERSLTSKGASKWSVALIRKWCKHQGRNSVIRVEHSSAISRNMIGTREGNQESTIREVIKFDAREE